MHPNSNMTQEGSITRIDVLSTGSNYVAGDLLIASSVSTTGSGFYGKFSTGLNGSVSNIQILNVGSGFQPSDLTNSFVSIVYSGTQQVQDGTVSILTLDSVGANYVPGDILISGPRGTGFLASFSVSPINGSLTRLIHQSSVLFGFLANA